MNRDGQDTQPDFVEAIPARGDQSYQPRPGDRSLLAGIGGFSFGLPESRDQRLAKPIRALTLDWLAMELALACQRSFGAAFYELVAAIPDGNEQILDGGSDFIFAVDQAALLLGGDPASVALRPHRLHS